METPVTTIDGRAHRMHNHYEWKKFFRSDGVGRIVDRHSQRVMLVSEDFILGYQVALEEEVGDAAGEIMYRCGYEWGKQDINRFLKRIQGELGQPAKNTPLGMFLETWWWPFQASGWGAWKYDLSHKKEGLVFVDLFDSAVARSTGNVGKVVCHYYAGMFAAVFSAIAKKELSGIEIQCYAMGEDFCKFLIGSSKRINSAQFWVQEGATAAEVIDRL